MAWCQASRPGSCPLYAHSPAPQPETTQGDGNEWPAFCSPVSHPLPCGSLYLTQWNQPVITTLLLMGHSMLPLKVYSLWKRWWKSFKAQHRLGVRESPTGCFAFTGLINTHRALWISSWRQLRLCVWLKKHNSTPPCWALLQLFHSSALRQLLYPTA